MNSLIVKNNSNFFILPTSLTEAMNYAKIIADSSFCPKEMKDKPGDILIAMQLGAEVGLSPMQALQNIAVINGRPSLWGDAALALVIASPNYISHKEWIEGSIKEKTLTAYCSIIRVNSEEYVKSFSQEDAERANLWSKQIWKQYPERMLQMRARAFCIRDKFADALRGINIAEEVRDYQVIEKKKNLNIIENEKPELLKMENKKEIYFDIDEALLNISQCSSLSELKEVVAKYSSFKSFLSDEDINKISKAKNRKQEEIKKDEISIKQREKDKKEFLEEYGSIDQETGEIKDLK